MTLSRKAKEAIKVALAMTIAYGIALSMDWDRPNWAGLAVAFVSLATIGQSINKAALRMFGTLVAMVVALTLIALFAQERWLFILVLSAYAGFCCYMISGGKHDYFWQVAAFVTVIICMDAGPDPINAFNTATLRAQETGLGILVYSLVAIFLWPSSSRAGFNAAATDLASIQRQLYQAYLGLMSGQGDEQEARRLAAQQAQAKTRFDQLLDAAETDSQEVWESRRQWRRYQRQAMELMQTMARWRESFAEVQTLDLQRMLPGIEAFGAELDGRMVQIGNMLAGTAPGQVPLSVDLSLDNNAVGNLSHFQLAALVVTRANMLHMDQLTRSLFEGVSELSGFGTASAPIEAPRAPAAVFLPDLDRLANVVRYMAIFWMAWLALIYVNDIPGGAGLVSFAGGLGIAVASLPQVPVSKLFKPVATSVLFAAVLYIFVMPQLSSFAGLGLLIFAVTFVIGYLYADPQQMIGRAAGLATFVVIASISNEQSYNFLSVANTAMTFILLLLILVITAYIPVSPRPERVFLRLLGRYFRSSEYLISAMRWYPAHAATRLERWKEAFHEREVATLPSKLGNWLPHLDTRVLSGATPEQAQALVTSLQSLTYRMQLLLDERDIPQAQFLVQELLEEFRAWRLGVQGFFQRLAEEPVIGGQDMLRTRLDGLVVHLESRIKDTLNKAPEGQLSNREAENFYRLLGAYRGVSEALVEYGANAAGIDWTPWREERFA